MAGNRAAHQGACRLKYWALVKRLDQVYGDRNFVCTCPPMGVWEAEHEGEKPGNGAFIDVTNATR